MAEYKCPRCGQTKEFIVTASVSVLVDGEDGDIDASTVSVDNLLDADGHDYMECSECHFDGILHDFARCARNDKAR